MKINYADRRNDNNILSKRFVMTTLSNQDFKGTVGLMLLEDVIKPLVVKRPNGKSEVVIDGGYKILTFFPEKGAYCCTVMINRENKILQWYFDILKGDCKFDSDVPYGEDVFLDVVLLPNGEYYMIDEDDLNDALNNKTITYEEFEKAYETAEKIKNFVKNNFDEISLFTKGAINKLEKHEK